MLMSPNKDETAVHGCHCQGDMAVRMRKVLQTAGLVFECVTCFFRVSYRYVPPQRVWFLSRFGLKTGIDFDHYGLKSGMVFKGTTGAYKRFVFSTPNE